MAVVEVHCSRSEGVAVPSPSKESQKLNNSLDERKEAIREKGAYSPTEN